MLDLEQLIEYKCNEIETTRIIIKTARLEQNITIKNLAEKLRMGRTTISRYENGRSTIPLSYLIKLKTFLNKEE